MHDVMMTAVHNARGCIEICLEAPEYREGLRYGMPSTSAFTIPRSDQRWRTAVTYTQTSAAFAAAFLLRFARLFPQDVDIEDSIRMVESLIRVFSESMYSHISCAYRADLSVQSPLRASFSPCVRWSSSRASVSKS